MGFASALDTPKVNKPEMGYSSLVQHKPDSRLHSNDRKRQVVDSGGPAEKLRAQGPSISKNAKHKRVNAIFVDNSKLTMLTVRSSAHFGPGRKSSVMRSQCSVPQPSACPANDGFIVEGHPPLRLVQADTPQSPNTRALAT